MHNLYLAIFKFLHLPNWFAELTWPIIPFIAIAALMVIVVIFLVLLERKVLALLTVRKGPNRVGYYGLLQTFADAIKLLFKEDIIPQKANRILFTVAPVIFFFPVMVIYGLIPFANNLIAIDASAGLLLILAVSSIGVLGLVSAGWASNNKYSLIGSMRSVAQAISYELPLVLSALGVAILAGSLNLNQIVVNQQGLWNFIPGLLGFLIFLICTIAEINRVPFDLPEAESELVSGYNTEYSGMKFALFFLAEYAALFIFSALIATLFFGGYLSPLGFFLLPKGAVWIEQAFWLMVKTYAIIFLIMWIRATLPRLRADQLMSFSWKFLLPLSLFNIVFLAIYKYFIG